VEQKLFGTFGKVAGIGGLALGVLLYTFREVLQQSLLFQTPLSSNEAFHVVAALLVFTFGIATIGIVAWLIAARNPDEPMPVSSLALLAFLFCLVMGSGVYLLTLAATPDRPKATSTTFRVCMGEGGGNNCSSGANASFDCNQYGGMGGGGERTTTELGARFCSTAVNGQKKQQPFDVKVFQNNGGGKCGWTGFLVTCNPSA
jgi:hypothetical protein